MARGVQKLTNKKVQLFLMRVLGPHLWQKSTEKENLCLLLPPSMLNPCLAMTLTLSFQFEKDISVLHQWGRLSGAFIQVPAMHSSGYRQTCTVVSQNGGFDPPAGHFPSGLCPGETLSKSLARRCTWRWARCCWLSMPVCISAVPKSTNPVC